MAKVADENAEREQDRIAVKDEEQVPLVDSDQFATIMGCIVLVNIVTIGLETEFSETSGLFGAVNNGFILCYIMELILRLLTHGMKALRDGFNVMDVIIVFLAFLERIMSSGGVARALPTFRTFRMVRLLQKSRFFKHSFELKGIFMLTKRMFRTLFWVMLILFLVLWVLAVFAHMVIGKSAEWNETLDPSKEFPPFVALDIQEYFGSVWKSFITLLQVTTLSQWAPHIARRIIKVYPLTFAFFVAFIWITTYGLLVAILSNLVQEAMISTHENAGAIRQMERAQRKEAGLRVRDILADIDVDGSGQLDESEIAWALKVTNLEDVLHELGVPVTDAQSLVCLLDYSGDGYVSYDELVQGIVAMDEHVTKRDFVMLGFWVKNLLHRTSHLEERLSKMCDQISYIRKRLSGSFGALNNMIRTSKETQMRQRALAHLKTAGPGLPPLLNKVVIAKPTLPKTEPKMMLQSFASRMLGKPPKPKRAGSPGLEDETPRTTSLFHNTMQPAPPRLAVGKRLAQQEELKWHDKYAVPDGCSEVFDFRRNNENPNLTALKSLL